MRNGKYPDICKPPDTGGAPFSMPAMTDAEIESEVLRRLGIGEPLIAEMAERATQSGATLERELLASGAVSEPAYYAGLAHLLSLSYLDKIPEGRLPDTAALDSQLTRPMMVRLQRPRKSALTALAPEARRLPQTMALLARNPGLRADMVVVSATTLRAAVWEAGRMRRVRDTITGLFERQPHLSARVVFWGRQGFYAGLGVSTVIAGLLLAPRPSIDVIHVVLTLLYFLTFLIKCCAIRHCREPAASIPPLPPLRDLPVYTVMVALYREEQVAAQLVTALRRLRWPTSRLDIKLVCEADDHATILALKSFDLPPHFEIVEVPPMAPRTKPKALTYALTAARGNYLAVYDAEDRPHPDQLREAYGKFRQAPDDIACLQAPLIIANARQSWLSALFSLEYSALFRALLPMLARSRMPLPLGGTSNHFRTDVLRAAGGWDPFNVTEDADLGMRLYRLGYRSDVLLRQTLEDAPTTARVWMNQRTRWFKGWLQTWLVMMRAPAELRREMGTSAFAMFNLLIGGMLISSLAHPFILLFIFVTIWALMQAPGEGLSIATQILFAMDFTNILGSYAAVLGVGSAAMIRHEKKLIGWRWLALPAYWMMVSAAAWRAVFELRSNPFLWRKTPHEPARCANAADSPAKAGQAATASTVMASKK